MYLHLKTTYLNVCYMFKLNRMWVHLDGIEFQKSLIGTLPWEMWTDFAAIRFCECLYLKTTIQYSFYKKECPHMILQLLGLVVNKRIFTLTFQIHNENPALVSTVTVRSSINKFYLTRSPNPVLSTTCFQDFASLLGT